MKLQISQAHFHPFNFHRLSNIGDGNGASAGRGRGQDLAVLLNIDERKSRWSHSGARQGARTRARKRDGAKVGKPHERARGAALLKVFHDSLGVVLAQLGGRGARGGDGLALGVDRECAGGERDGVARRERDAAELVGYVNAKVKTR